MGNTVKVVPIHAELPPLEGADLLKFADLMEYKNRREQDSHAIQDELAT